MWEFNSLTYNSDLRGYSEMCYVSEFGTNTFSCVIFSSSFQERKWRDTWIGVLGDLYGQKEKLNDRW